MEKNKCKYNNNGCGLCSHPNLLKFIYAQASVERQMRTAAVQIPSGVEGGSVVIDEGTGEVTGRCRVLGGCDEFKVLV